MHHLKYLLRILLSITLLGSIALQVACHRQDPSKVIKVGTIAGPETQLMEVAKEVAQKKYGTTIKIVEFTDYVMPNEALAEGSIDANMFQHAPYLQSYIARKGYKLVEIGKTFVYPMGIYSNKIKNLADLKTGATVAIPNDPSNGARALLLLNKAGLIQLKTNAGTNVSIRDIIANPKNLKIKELDAAQLPRVLPDVDLAIINTNYAILANLFATRDALFVESSDSPYANIIVIRAEDQNNPKFKILMNALHSDEVIAKAKELFKGQAISAWDQKK